MHWAILEDKDHTIRVTQYSFNMPLSPMELLSATMSKNEKHTL